MPDWSGAQNVGDESPTGSGTSRSASRADGTEWSTPSKPAVGDGGASVAAGAAVAAATWWPAALATPVPMAAMVPNAPIAAPTVNRTAAAAGRNPLRSKPDRDDMTISFEVATYGCGVGAMG